MHFMPIDSTLNQNYSQLKELIEKRQKYEKLHPYPPFSQKPTTLNFKDINGNTLLHYAAAMGDIDKVKFCLENGQNIDSTNSSGTSAIILAVENGHLDVAEFLFQRGINCTSLTLNHTKSNPKLYAWLHDKISQDLKKACPNPNKVSSDPLPSSSYQFISPSISNINVNAFERAVEIGDLHFLETGFDTLQQHLQSNNVYNFQDVMEGLLIIAAGNGHLKIVEFLSNHQIKLSRTKKFTDTALIEAIKENKQEVIAFLLSHDIDINQETRLRDTALTQCIIKNDQDTLEKLIALKANLKHVNIHGNTFLHQAVINNSKLILFLLTLPACQEMILAKNIYGQTLLDLAIQHKNDEIIQLLNPRSDLQLIKQHPQYGKKPVNISQSAVMDKMLYWLNFNYRDTNFFAFDGHCNGFSYLKNYYAEKGMEDYYFDTMERMSSWDGTNESLVKKFAEEPQAAYYDNLDDLFEQWINDVVWFQFATIDFYEKGSHRPAENREAQYALIKENSNDFNFIMLYDEPFFTKDEHGNNIYFRRTEPQLQELYYYLSRLPPAIKLEFRGSFHATSGYTNDKKEFVFYDSNIPWRLTGGFSNSNEMLSTIFNFQFIAARNYRDTFELNCRTFCYAKNLEHMKLDEFWVFAEHELPKSKEEALAFQTQSLNKFTHLHIAVITRSLACVRWLLKDGHCDVNAKDSLGRNALKIALDSKFIPAIHLLLESQQIPQPIVETYLVKAYKKNRQDVVRTVIDSPFLDNLNRLLKVAIINQDNALVAKLLEHKKASLNKQGQTDLLLLKAIKTKDTELLKILIDNGINVQLTDAKGKTIFDYLKSGTLLYTCKSSVMAFLSACPFKLSEPEDRKIVLNLLTLTAQEYDNDLFKLVLERCDKALIQESLVNNNHLLHYFLFEKRFDRIEPLLRQGTYVDTPLANGNTPLMGIIKNPDLPQKYDLIPLFIKYKADLTLKNRDSKTVLDLVAESNDPKIKEIFVNHNLIESEEPKYRLAP